jgi:hypothetical protein
MRAIHTIVSIGTLSGIFLASNFTLIACQKKPSDTDSVTPGKDDDKDDDDERQQCGGFGGLPCADGMTCVDDPSDSCDPMQGGADCMGICVEGDDDKDDGDGKQCDFAADPNKSYVGKSPDACATMRFVCEEGKEYFSDECGCGCVTTPPAS